MPSYTNNWGDLVLTTDIDRAYREGRMSLGSKIRYEIEMEKEAKRQEDFRIFSRPLGDSLSQQIIKSSQLNRIKDEPPVIIQPMVYSPPIKDEPFIDPTRDMFKFYKL